MLWFAVFVGVVMAIVLPMYAIQRQGQKLERFRHEAAALGFAQSPVGGAVGRNHMVGSYQGVPTVLAYALPAGTDDATPGPSGILVRMAVASQGADITVVDASRFAKGSTTEVVIAATWPRGWSGPVAELWLPLDADRHAMRAGLDRVLEAR
ncbi:MAG: hypothetical protein AAF602_05395 [Myxococcota bacterium]